MRFLPILFLFSYLGSSCSPFGQSEPRMTDEQFVAFFVAMSNATKQHADAPVQLREAHRTLYRKYDTSPEAAQATVDRYQEQPEKWVTILERIGEELRRSEKEGRGDKQPEETHVNAP